MPSVVLTAVIGVAMLGLVAVTVTPGNTPPSESFTTPRMVPSPDAWAHAALATPIDGSSASKPSFNIITSSSPAVLLLRHSLMASAPTGTTYSRSSRSHVVSALPDEA